MLATAIKDRYVVIVTDDNQINISDKGIGRDTILLQVATLTCLAACVFTVDIYASS